MCSSDLPLLSKGVVIVSTTPGTPSGNYGFQAGDIVRGVNGAEIGSVAALQKALGSANAWSLVVDRGGQRMSLNVQG